MGVKGLVEIFKSQIFFNIQKENKFKLKRVITC